MNLNPAQKAERTISQNNALHKYCELIAIALNDAGYSIPEVLKHFKMEVEWSKENVKEILWRTAQERRFKKHSTTKLLKHKEIDLIYDVMNRFLGEKLHIENIPFPSSNDDLKL